MAHHLETLVGVKELQSDFPVQQLSPQRFRRLKSGHAVVLPVRLGLGHDEIWRIGLLREADTPMVDEAFPEGQEITTRACRSHARLRRFL